MAGAIPVIISVIMDGVTCSLKLHRAIRYLVDSPIAFDRMQRSLVLNGLLFAGTFAFSIWVLPVAMNFFETRLVNGEDGTVDKEYVASIRDTATFVLNLAWFYPLLPLSYALSLSWWSDLALEIFKLTHRDSPPPTPPTMGKFLRDEAYRVLLVTVITVQLLAVDQVRVLYPHPITDTLVYLFVLAENAWMVSFYCFDYGWALAGLSIEARLAKFESVWAFMLGYGLLLAFVGMVLPLLSSFILYLLVFPLCLSVALVTQPIPHERGWPRIRVFRSAQLILWFILSKAVAV